MQELKAEMQSTRHSMCKRTMGTINVSKQKPHLSHISGTSHSKSKCACHFGKFKMLGKVILWDHLQVILSG